MEWVETTAKSVDEAQRRALDLLGIAAEDAEVEVVDAGSVGWFGRVKTEARVRARVRPRAQVTEERSRRRDNRRGGGKSRNQGKNDGGNRGGGRDGGNSRGGSRDGGGRDGGKSRDGGGSSRGGSRDGGGRDGGKSRDGGGRDGGKGRGGSRDGGSRDGGSSRGRNNQGGQRSESGSNRGAAAAAVGGGAAVAAAAGSGDTRGRDSAGRDSAGNGGGSQRQERSSGGDGRRDQDRSRNRSKSSQASEANVEDEYPAEEQKSVVVDFVAGLAEIFDGDAGVDSTDDGETITVDVSGDDLGLLIGPGAHTLSAIEELTRTTMQRAAGGRRYRRVRVDVDGYRARRNEALVAFAGKVADDVRSSGDRKKLEPMNSADRKVVHDAVGDLDGVSTVSEGNDPRRYVVIVPD